MVGVIKMGFLDANFYKNYILLDNPLDVEYNGYDVYSFKTVENSSNLILEAGYTDYSKSIFDCKPFLVAPEDLTDEQWLWVFCGDDQEHGLVITRDSEEESIYLHIKEHNTLHYQNVFFLSGHFEYSDQEILDRLYSLHSHPKANEYIKNNLAKRKIK